MILFLWSYVKYSKRTAYDIQKHWNPDFFSIDRVPWTLYLGWELVISDRNPPREQAHCRCSSQCGHCCSHRWADCTCRTFPVSGSTPVLSCLCSNFYSISSSKTTQKFPPQGWPPWPASLDSCLAAPWRWRMRFRIGPGLTPLFFH